MAILASWYNERIVVMPKGTREHAAYLQNPQSVTVKELESSPLKVIIKVIFLNIATALKFT